MSRGVSILIDRRLRVRRAGCNRDDRSEGTRKMDVKRVINLVGTECRPGDDDKFNDWYAEHIRELMKFQGLKGAVRFKRIGDKSTYPKYLCIYEFETPQDFAAYDSGPEFAAAEASRVAFWGEKGFDLIWRMQYEKIATFNR